LDALPTHKDLTFCDEFVVTLELFYITTFHFMTFSMEQHNLTTKMKCLSQRESNNHHKLD
uniref:Uncharacterized protein n=1 Tax=Setaria italica TaxID=4555 RepID=K3YMH0_SETIT